MTSNASGRRKYTPIGMRLLFGLFRLLLETDHLAIAVQLGDAEPLRVRHAVEQAAGAPRPRLELAGDIGELGPRRMLSPRTTQKACRRRSRGPGRWRGRCRGRPADIDRSGRGRSGCRRPGAPRCRRRSCRRRPPSRRDPHPGERLDRVVDHRPVVDRQQVLVRDDRQRIQPRSRSRRRARGPSSRQRVTGRITRSTPRDGALKGQGFFVGLARGDGDGVT